MSSVSRRLATFAVMLAGLFTVGAAAGQIIDPKRPVEKPRRTTRRRRL